MSKRYNGIAGVTGREPVGAVLRVGKKGPRGAPTERDRFYVCQPKQDSSKSRPLDPRFKAFNESNALEWRQDIIGALVHGSAEDAWGSQLLCHKPNGEAKTPAGQPFCVGDGEKATRWSGAAQEFVEIECTNKACMFRQKSRSRDGCKPHLYFLFRPEWPAGSKLPTPLMRLDSRSWNSVANFKGFFDHIQEQVDGLLAQGVIDVIPTLYGLRFRLSLREQTSSGDGGRRFPVLSITPLESVSDWLERTAAQMTRIKESFESAQDISEEENVSHVEDISPFDGRRISSPASDGAK